MERSGMTGGVRYSPSFHFVPFRLLLTPTKVGHTPLPTKSDGGLDWSQVTAVENLEVRDYH